MTRAEQRSLDGCHLRRAQCARAGARCGKTPCAGRSEALSRLGLVRTPLAAMRTAIDVVLVKPEPSRGELVSMAAEVRQAAGHAKRLMETQCRTDTEAGRALRPGLGDQIGGGRG
jgi:hypothetical protein